LSSNLVVGAVRVGNLKIYKISLNQ